MRIWKWQIRRFQPVPVQQPLLPGLLVTEDLADQHISPEVRTVLARVVRGMVKDLLGDLSEAPERLITPTIRAHLEQLAKAAAHEAIIGHVFRGINVLEADSNANLVPQQRSDGAIGVRPTDPASDPAPGEAGS